jgi:hypothetical protein
MLIRSLEEELGLRLFERTTRRVMLTDAGDTIATEVVDDGAGWLESVVRLPRRGEVHRLFVTFDAAGTPLRWDVHSAWHPSRDRPDERWRTLVHGDSLFVVQGALIGVPVSITALAAPRAASPWHDASVALLELAGRQAAPTVTALTIFLAYGTTGSVARLLGAGDVGAALRHGVSAMWLGAGIGTVSAALGWTLTQPVVALFGAPAEVADVNLKALFQ